MTFSKNRNQNQLRNNQHGHKPVRIAQAGEQCLVEKSEGVRKSRIKIPACEGKIQEYKKNPQPEMPENASSYAFSFVNPVFQVISRNNKEKRNAYAGKAEGEAQKQGPVYIDEQVRVNRNNHQAETKPQEINCFVSAHGFLFSLSRRIGFISSI